MIQSLKDSAGTQEINEYMEGILRCVKGNRKMQRWQKAVQGSSLHRVLFILREARQSISLEQ